MLAKQPVRISMEDLKEVLELPEEVTIVDVVINRMYGLTEIEFTLMSAEPIEGLTRVYEPETQAIRRISVAGIKKWKENQNG